MNSNVEFSNELLYLSHVQMESPEEKRRRLEQELADAKDKLKYYTNLLEVIGPKTHPDDLRGLRHDWITKNEQLIADIENELK